MVVESVVLLCVAVMLFVACARAKHFGYAFAAALPVAVVPAMYLIATGVLAITGTRFFGVRVEMVLAFVAVLAIAVSCAVVVLFSRQIKSKANSHLYLFVFLVYNVVLGWVYIYNIIRPLLV